MTKRLQIMSWTSLAKAIVYVLIFMNMICRSKSGKICWNYSERLILWRSVPISSDQSYYSNIKKCQTNLDLSLFFAWSAAMHISWNIRNFAHDKRVQSPQVSTGFFSTPVIGGSVAEWSARRTRNPGSWVRVPLWPLAGFVLGRPEFKSSAALINSQLVASCQLGFLILLCCIWIICF